MAEKCTETTAKKAPCKSWAVPGTNPPLCASHGGTRKGPGAPEGNQNATKHGYYSTRDLPFASPDTLKQVIGNLNYLHQKLFDYIKARFPDKLETHEIISLFDLFGRNSNRVGRLFRDKKAVSGEAADGLAGAIADAADELSILFGIDLRGD